MRQISTLLWCQACIRRVSAAAASEIWRYRTRLAQEEYCLLFAGINNNPANHFRT